MTPHRGPVRFGSSLRRARRWSRGLTDGSGCRAQRCSGSGGAGEAPGPLGPAEGERRREAEGRESPTSLPPARRPPASSSRPASSGSRRRRRRARRPPRAANDRRTPRSRRARRARRRRHDGPQAGSGSRHPRLAARSWPRSPREGSTGDGGEQGDAHAPRRGGGSPITIDSGMPSRTSRARCERRAPACSPPSPCACRRRPVDPADRRRRTPGAGEEPDRPALAAGVAAASPTSS